MSQTQCGSGKVKGIETRIILHPLTTNEMQLPGQNNGQLPGWTSETITDDSFDKEIAGKELGSKTYADIQVSMYMMPGNKAQEEIRVLSADQVKFNDIWMKYGKSGKEFVHFWALDLATDPCGTVALGGYNPQSFGRNDMIQVQSTLAVNGAGAFYEYHTDDLDWTLDSSGNLEAIDGDFVNMGFKAGMSVIAETGDQAAPYVYGIITAATATKLTLESTVNPIGQAMPTTGEGKVHAARIHYK